MILTCTDNRISEFVNCCSAKVYLDLASTGLRVSEVLRNFSELFRETATPKKMSLFADMDSFFDFIHSFKRKRARYANVEECLPLFSFASLNIYQSQIQKEFQVSLKYHFYYVGNSKTPSQQTKSNSEVMRTLCDILRFINQYFEEKDYDKAHLKSMQIHIYSFIASNATEASLSDTLGKGRCMTSKFETKTENETYLICFCFPDNTYTRKCTITKIIIQDNQSILKYFDYYWYLQHNFKFIVYHNDVEKEDLFSGLKAIK